jgi:VanZ family protein
VGATLNGLSGKLRSWLPVVLWAALISDLSTDLFSASHTSLIIIPLLHWLLPYANPETLEQMHFFIRKLAHFSEYFVLSVLLMRALRGKDRGWQLRWAIWALVIAAGYSALDEFHQSFVPSRTASPWDSLLDTTGAAAAQVVLWLWFYLQRRREVSWYS